MTAETIIVSIILLISAAPIIIIGIVQYRSKDPVGFWSGKKPPRKEQITDVKAYNQKHGLMWILFGVGFVLCFVCGLPFGGLIAGYLCMVEVMGGILVMVAYHNKLNRMYYRKQGDV
ncbi:MAG: hypothetical protein HDR05_02695 [Lachnospiraceae bacterium]|nr:hypothetical protein [Lachnospiraceae bacterium]